MERDTMSGPQNQAHWMASRRVCGARVTAAFDAADDFLMANNGIGLEEVLCDGCYAGRDGAAVERVVQIMPRLSRLLREDRGVAHAYEGTLAVARVRYRFVCHGVVNR